MLLDQTVIYPQSHITVKRLKSSCRYCLKMETLEVWRDIVMVGALDLRSSGCGLDSQLFHFHVTNLGKLFTHTRASVTKQCNLVPAKQR